MVREREVAAVMTRDDVDVFVVGGGPSGLAAATRLRALGTRRVMVADREHALGGIPRHCGHLGFGFLDLRTVATGPAYAQARVALAAGSGVVLAPCTTVLGVGPGSQHLVAKTTSPHGPRIVQARALLLATGCRERPRAARMVSGTRPAGVLTTGSLQQLVHLRHAEVGRRALVVGAEHVSYSAVMTLRDAGARVIAMTTELDRHQTFSMVALGTRRILDVPLHTGTRVTAIHGNRRVEAVTLHVLATGEEHVVACDTVVFTGDWIPDHELARATGIALDAGTRGPAVDCNFRTSTRGVFCAGNALRGAETADRAALEGEAAADAIARYLNGQPWPDASDVVPIELDAPLAWISPNRIVAGAARASFTLRVREPRRAGTLEVSQNGQVLAHRRLLLPAIPNRAVRLSGEWASRVDVRGAPVRIRLT